MPSLVEIYNQTLVLIGESTVNSPTTPGPATTIGAVYGPAVDKVLEEHPWNFALARAALAPDVATPAFGFAYQYTLPTDPPCLRFWRAESADIAIRREGSKLLTDEPTILKIVFVSRVTDPEQFTGSFTGCLAAWLAHLTAPNITGAKRMAGEMLKLYDARLRLARSLDGQEGTPEDIEADDWVNARL